MDRRGGNVSELRSMGVWEEDGKRVVRCWLIVVRTGRRVAILNSDF